MTFKRSAGYTLVEMMMVVVIMGILSTIVAPRMSRVLDRAYEAKAKSNLGALRSTLQLYYSDNEGKIPFLGEPDGVASDRGMSLSRVLAPKYIAKIPTPYLSDRYTFVPGMKYDEQCKTNMAQNPPYDIVFSVGDPAVIVLDRPYVYDPSNGHVYFCNGNLSLSEEGYYKW